MCRMRQIETQPVEDPPAAPEQLPGPSDLVGDDDREHTSAVLQRAAGAGLLSLADVDDRLRRAWAAGTVAELAAATEGLPPGWLNGLAQEKRRTDTASEAERALRSRVATYLAVMVLLVTIWAVTGAGYPWPVWPALGWGIALGQQARATRALTRSTSRAALP